MPTQPVKSRWAKPLVLPYLPDIDNRLGFTCSRLSQTGLLFTYYIQFKPPVGSTRPCTDPPCAGPPLRPRSGSGPPCAGPPLCPSHRSRAPGRAVCHLSNKCCWKCDTARSHELTGRTSRDPVGRERVEAGSAGATTGKRGR